jgi:hypothetical protein
MALNGRLKTTNNNLAGGTKNASGNGVVKSNGAIENGGTIRNDGTILSLIHMVFCYHPTLLWDFSTSCKKITKGSKQKNYKIYKNFNINHMKVCWRLMHK